MIEISECVKPKWVLRVTAGKTPLHLPRKAIMWYYILRLKIIWVPGTKLLSRSYIGIAHSAVCAFLN